MGDVMIPADAEPIRGSIKKGGVEETKAETGLSGSLQRKLLHILEDSSLVGDSCADFVRRIQDQSPTSAPRRGAPHVGIIGTLESPSTLSQSLANSPRVFWDALTGSSHKLSTKLIVVGSGNAVAARTT